jgi:hypothetical protein
MPRGASETSEWCRAEYRPALSIEATGALSRVAVAVLGPGAIIPSEFAGCPKFQVSDQIDDLANFLRGQNRLPFTPNDLMSRGLRVSRESLQKALENEPAPRHPEAKLALSLAKAAAAGPFDADDINRRLLPLSQKLLRTPQLISELEPQEIDILRTLAVFIAREGSADVRMNGFWLLSALADDHNALITPDDLVQILAGESDPSIISSMARTLDLIRPKLTPSAQSSIEFLALKQFYGRPGTSLPLMELSEAVAVAFWLLRRKRWESFPSLSERYWPSSSCLP